MITEMPPDQDLRREFERIAGKSYFVRDCDARSLALRKRAFIVRIEQFKSSAESRCVPSIDNPGND
jgi:hypothetical protein